MKKINRYRQTIIHNPLHLYTVRGIKLCTVRKRVQHRIFTPNRVIPAKVEFH